MMDYSSWKNMIYSYVGMLFYGTKKDKEQKGFNLYMIRRALLGKKIIQQIYQKTPGWVSPIEAFMQPHLMTEAKLLRYQDLFKN